jgi:hypothetical protein
MSIGSSGLHHTGCIECGPDPHKRQFPKMPLR